MLFGTQTGEAKLSRGSLWVKPGVEIAYCPQQPWIIAGSFRQNILFNKGNDGVDEYNESRYDNIGWCFNGFGQWLYRPCVTCLMGACGCFPPRYVKALEACDLGPDLELLPYGDMVSGICLTRNLRCDGE